MKREWITLVDAYNDAIAHFGQSADGTVGQDFMVPVGILPASMLV
jgi:hypothetical protein